MTPEEALVDKAQLLKLTAPEVTVLIGACVFLARMPGIPLTAFSPTGRRR